MSMFIPVGKAPSPARLRDDVDYLRQQARRCLAAAATAPSSRDRLSLSELARHYQSQLARAAETLGEERRRIKAARAEGRPVACSPANPWGIHDRLVGNRCRRCGWSALRSEREGG